MGIAGLLASTHIMFYKERFIRNDFRTSQNFEKNKKQTSHFSKKQGTLYCIDGFCKEQQTSLNFQFHPKYMKSRVHLLLYP